MDDEPSIRLSGRTRALFAIITAAAAAGAPTPSAPELEAALQAAGHKVGGNPGQIGYELRRLQHAGRITIIGRQRRRVFEIAGTGQRTVRPPAGNRALMLVRVQPRRGADPAGWPRPTRQSAASYDAAVRRREFARHEHPEPSGPLVQIRPPARQSPTGCATALMAAW
ncbi:hypothetical protein [Inquilinus sp.]|jgi:hypothetical protein|uniref:hypothetical protein n=1 Tax=Inquilinus sp. TaxID=1932117 RepID=UPI003783CB4A